MQAIRELRVAVGADEPAGVTSSVGVACSAELPEDRDEDALQVAADLAMYDAKRTGRDGYAVHLGPGLALDRPALALPARHAAVDDVDDLARAVALQQARGDGARAGRRRR